jgi:hypothetical protein
MLSINKSQQIIDPQHIIRHQKASMHNTASRIIIITTITIKRAPVHNTPSCIVSVEEEGP